MVYFENTFAVKFVVYFPQVPEIIQQFETILAGLAWRTVYLSQLQGRISEFSLIKINFSKQGLCRTLGSTSSFTARNCWRKIWNCFFKISFYLCVHSFRFGLYYIINLGSNYRLSK